MDVIQFAGPVPNCAGTGLAARNTRAWYESIYIFRGLFHFKLMKNGVFQAAVKVVLQLRFAISAIRFAS
ncbi:hypothetical protein [Roseibium sp. RKSG952]|uniref:hypothetical protein n=1 Tax=Roseibium sp. RKSG952 TaxID=2529384 RepID=UPI0012BD57A5|nr:hypothetical protein [Roseibium sp. RKSG952]MTH96922.1 hypothetical protein [Roseibium sp. RKSG952]